MDRVLDFVREWSAPALLFLVTSTTIIPVIKGAMRVIARSLHRGQVYAAQYTPKWDGDDRFFAFALRMVDRSVVALDYALGFFEAILRIVRFVVDHVPVVSVGRMHRQQDADHGSGVGGMPMLALLFSFSLVASGCTHDPQVRDARLARWDFILGGIEYGLVELGDFLRPMYDAADARCAENRDEYDACIRNWEVTIDSIAHAYHDVQLARIGIALGTGADAVPCVARSVEAAVGAVLSLPGVELPPKYTALVESARSLAGAFGGECAAQPPETETAVTVELD